MSGYPERRYIAVGVILNPSAEKVLISRRHDHVHLGGMWEFPGGKMLPGENVLDALKRELLEELNITIKSARPLIQIKHDYVDEAVHLDVWLVTDWSGAPEGMEGQEITWAEKRQLAAADFPEADRSIITAVNLPDIYGITRDQDDYGDEFFSKLEHLLSTGLKLLQFRSKQLDDDARYAVIKEMYTLCCRFGCRLLINGIPNQRMMKYIHGVHLPGRILPGLNSRPLDMKYLVAASCHNYLEIEHASNIGADFVVVSPVKITASHESVIPMGWDRFTELTATAKIPVYALGGMQKQDIGKSQTCGGQGVAMISGLWD